MNKHLLLSLLALVFLNFGCGTMPVKYDGIQEGNWKAKALVKDKDQKRSYIVNLNLNAVRDKQVRMDVTTTLGTAVAALYLEGKEVKYLLVEPKKYYYGKAQPDVMRPILSIPFDPSWLNNVLFEIPFAEKNWTCTKDAKGFLQQCVDGMTNLKVTWADRVGERKTIHFEHARANVQMNVISFKPKVEDRKGLFELKAPENFEKLRVR